MSLFKSLVHPCINVTWAYLPGPPALFMKLWRDGSGLGMIITKMLTLQIGFVAIINNILREPMGVIYSHAEGSYTFCMTCTMNVSSFLVCILHACWHIHTSLLILTTLLNAGQSAGWDETYLFKHCKCCFNSCCRHFTMGNLSTSLLQKM